MEKIYPSCFKKLSNLTYNILYISSSPFSVIIECIPMKPYI